MGAGPAVLTAVISHDCQSGVWAGADGAAPTIFKTPLYMGGSGTINLGPQKFCALGSYRSDSGDDGLCNVYKNGDNWYFSRSQQSYVGCGAICFN